MEILRIKALGHDFGGLRALSGFDLALDEREFVGVIGPNGSGKTTLFNLVSGIYRAATGSISFRGRELVGMSPSSIAHLGITRTFQNIRLFKELTVLDNVRVAKYAAVRYSGLEALLHVGRFRTEERRLTEEAMELLTLFGLDDKAEDPAKNLPYGLQRRLEMARALAASPNVLLLDEPGAGMNPAEIGRLIQLLQWTKEHFPIAIVLIEHHMKMVMELCQRIKVLDFGVTISEGTPMQIRQDPKVIEVYLGKKDYAAVAGRTENTGYGHTADNRPHG
ncbi:MAG: ABC transporter ATP-binding protein [Nitrospirae bacterium]|nr:ABC transporter ATP-binding protein [Nitrospirota bacterium]